jgi:hypothetical protein
VSVDSGNKFNRQRILFETVINSYKEILALSPVVASQIDPDAPTHSRKLDFVALEYKCDIENAAKHAFHNQPDEQALKDGIDRIIAEDPTVPHTLVHRIIRLTAPVLERRQLEPFKYMVRVRHGRRAA